MIPEKSPTLASSSLSLVAETLPDTSVKIGVLRDGRKTATQRSRLRNFPEDLEMLASADEARGKHALAGITVKPASRNKGVEVTDVKAGSAANRAGIQKGDLILGDQP